MNIKYNVKVPEKGRKKSDEVMAVEAFLGMKDMKNMMIEYESLEEAKKKMSTIRSFRAANELQQVIDVIRVETNIYVVRKNKEEK